MRFSGIRYPWSCLLLNFSYESVISYEIIIKGRHSLMKHTNYHIYNTVYCLWKELGPSNKKGIKDQSLHYPLSHVEIFMFIIQLVSNKATQTELQYFKPGAQWPQANMHLISFNCFCMDICMRVSAPEAMNCDGAHLTRLPVASL